MEVEAIRANPDESNKRPNVGSKTSGGEGKEKSHKPVFGPPVPRRSNADSLHGSLRSVLGCFDEVAPYLARLNQKPCNLFGVDPCPPTPQDLAGSKSPRFFIGTPDDVPAATKESIGRKSQDSKRRKSEKSKSKSSSGAKSQQKEYNKTQKHGLERAFAASNKEEKDRAKKADKETWKVPEKKVKKPVPRLKIPVSDDEYLSPDGSKEDEDDGCSATPLKVMVKNMQNLVATPLSRVKDEPFSYPHQHDTPQDSLAVDDLKNVSRPTVNGKSPQQPTLVATAAAVKSREEKSTKKQAEVASSDFGELVSDLRLSEESDLEDNQDSTAQQTDSRTNMTLSSANQDKWNLDIWFNETGNNAESHKYKKQSEPEDSAKKRQKCKSSGSSSKRHSSSSDPAEKERRKKLKKKSSTSSNKHSCPEAKQPSVEATNFQSSKHSSPAVEVQSPDSGFVDGSSPGKENVVGDDGGKTDAALTNSTKNAQAVLHESRLSPLLSPIPEFPPLVIGTDGQPSLMCRINLALLEKIGKYPQREEHSFGEKKRAVDELFSVKAEGEEEDVDEVPLDIRKEERKGKKRKSQEKDRASDSAKKKKLEDDGARLVPPPKLSPIKPFIEDEPAPKKPKEKEKKGKAAKAVDKRREEGDNKQIDSGDQSANRNDVPERLPKIEDGHSQASAAPKPANAEPDLPLFAPVTKIELENDLFPADFYLNRKAKPIKHEADALQSNNPFKILLYLESIVYFLMTVRALEQQVNRESSRPFSMAKETYELLRQVTQRFAGQASSQRLQDSARELVGRIQVLSLRAQAVICYKLYSLRLAQTFINYRTLNEYHSRVRQGGTPAAHTTPSTSEAVGQPQSSNTSSTPSPTPSPASSVGSGSANSLPPGHVLVPQKIEQLYKQQLSYLHHLMWAHRHWEAADEQLRPEDRGLFNHLDSLCGQLSIQSNFADLCVYVLTAVDWLKALHPST